MNNDPTLYEVWLTIPEETREAFIRFWAGEASLPTYHVDRLNTIQQKVVEYFNMEFAIKELQHES